MGDVSNCRIGEWALLGFDTRASGNNRHEKTMLTQPTKIKGMTASSVRPASHKPPPHDPATKVSDPQSRIRP